MTTILDKLAAHARERVAAAKEKISPEAMRARAQEIARTERNGGAAFTEALKKPGLGFICEVKRASPSKGLIAPCFPYVDLTLEYEKAGADAISCLTEPKWFLGSDEIFRHIRAAVRTPMLRKDFTVDEYQLYEAKVLGADAVLLICAILDTATVEKYLQICADLGLAALVEAHDEREVRSALSAGAKIVGVNNRDLRDFSVDLGNAARLRDLIPPDRVFVSESGVKGPEDAARVRAMGADAALVGEALMRSDNKTELLKKMREAAK